MSVYKILLKVLCFIRILPSFSLASDPITFDSLFKKQIGLRSITTLEYLSSGNADFYNTFPFISVYNDGRNYTDNKQFSLRQNFIYSLNNKLDVMLSAKASFVRSDSEQISFFAPTSYTHEQYTNFDNLSLGLVYSFENLGDFVPQLSASISVFDRVRFTTAKKLFYASSGNLQLSFKTFSDPLILSLYLGSAYNSTLHFKSNKVNFGNAVFAGFNGSIILSPKVSLDIGFSQSYQQGSKFNGRQYTSSYSIPNISLGFSYSLNDDTAISLSGSASGSNSAPNSIFALSLWKKF
ncbi:hypothetical protein [Campylobacter sp. MIT 97-5078]|uniref:hypothetical protein n=1 Tax=Campylobacter sp. MIT 97-5078 TaxID=1548153 RepID=UPI00068B5EF4|nr:hypothetical protein [Campylobacter sp. MIT 97-5078]